MKNRKGLGCLLLIGLVIWFIFYSQWEYKRTHYFGPIKNSDSIMASPLPPKQPLSNPLDTGELKVDTLHISDSLLELLNEYQMYYFDNEDF